MRAAIDQCDWLSELPGRRVPVVCGGGVELFVVAIALLSKDVADGMRARVWQNSQL